MQGSSFVFQLLLHLNAYWIALYGVTELAIFLWKGEGVV